MYEHPEDVHPAVRVPLARHERLDRFQFKEIGVAVFGLRAGVPRHLMAVVGDDVEHGILVVVATCKGRHVRHVVRDPRHGPESVLRDLVDAFEVYKVLEETRVANCRHC